MASPASSLGPSAPGTGSDAPGECTPGEGPSARQWQESPGGESAFPGASPRSCNPPRRECTGCEPGPSSSTTTYRPQRTCVLHTRLTSYLGVQGEGCRTGRARRSSNALPPAKFLPLGALLSHGDRPGPRACETTLSSSAPSPATLTTRSHRHRSPPGTGSDNAQAPPRLSCSAPAGRTWASPETFSSGGRGVRWWPYWAPACTRTLSPPSLPARAGGDPALAARAGVA